jgi:hypothetical protein
MEDGQWQGVGKAEALLVLHPLAADKRLEGELSVCFADRTKSCVLGAFVADYCQLSIDAPIRGTQLMEAPTTAQPKGDQSRAATTETLEGKP